MSFYRAVRIVLGSSLAFGALLYGDDMQRPAAPPMSQYLAHASTDKPIYRAGEILYLRAVVLGANDHKPMSDDGSVAMVQINGPKGEIVASGYAGVQDSVASFAWQVPAGSAGGQYTAAVNFPSQGLPPAVRKFEVRAYRAPRLKGEIVFLRDGFGPGDSVKASMHVERAEGGLPAGAQVTANAIVDGNEIYTGKTRIDASGNCSVDFALPKEIARGDGTLSLAVTDGGVVEPIAKTIPILVKTMDVSFYPEGGDLIAGLPCRVYVEARTLSKKPADLVGTIVDSKGAQVAVIRTEHEGRGRFTFTPRKGEAYSMKVSQPAGIERTFALSAVKDSGATIHSGQDLVESGRAVTVEVASSLSGSYTVVLNKRQTEVAMLKVDLKAGEPLQLTLTPPASADGVLTATLKDEKGTPLAERLIFRRPDRVLHINVTADKPSYVPGDSATLTVTTTDDRGKPVAAVVGLTATDDSVLQMIEKRDRAPRLGEMVFLEDDVKVLADADVYLDNADPKAPMAMDLLLGTQGWRRFATADEAKFLSANGDNGRRAMADMKPELPQARFAEFDGLEKDVNGMHARPAGARAIQKAAAMRENPVNAAPPLVPGLKAAHDDVLLAVDEDEVGDVASIAATRPSLPPGLQFRRGGEMNPAQQQMEIVRIYAHDSRPNRRDGERNDFTETLFWSAGIKTDARTGTATVSFRMNDAVSGFKVTADAFDASGELGEGTTVISSVQPFFIEPKIPLEVSAGDVIRMPIAAMNSTKADLPVTFTLTAGQDIGVMPVESFTLPAGARERRIAEVHIGSVPMESDFLVKASAGDYSDEVTRKMSVVPLGYPTEIAKGGLAQANGKVTQTIDIPDSVVANSVKTNIALYPTPMGNLNEALTRLMQEPYGCFEQTTSTTYPLVMADQYFMTHTGVDPAVIEKSSELLAKGYDRLRGFECKGKGYEWFGEDPGHECLSAYGLMEFTDMSAVRTVDAGMLANTKTWLLARRDGKGGFTHERRALHTWTADQDCSNGYCTWALLECGEKNLDAEVKFLKEHAAVNPNTYVTALAANVMELAGDKEAARGFMDKLAAKQDADGHVLDATTTVVGSGGDSLQVETTSLAALAWMREPAYAGQVEKAIHFLADSCKAGRYGSTQSTVLALRAIVAYDKSRAHATAPGKVQLFVDDKAAGDALAFSTETQGALKLPDISKFLTPGRHQIELRMTDGSSLPYAMAVSFHSATPASSDQCQVSIETKLAAEEVTEGAATQANVTVTNKSDKAIPTPIAIVGLPGGLEVRHEQLKELVKAGRIAAYEVRGREVILYWGDMQPNQRIEIPLSLIAAVPGTYTGPASRAYLYYTDEFKQWQPGMKVTIK